MANRIRSGFAALATASLLSGAVAPAAFASTAAHRPSAIRVTGAGSLTAGSTAFGKLSFTATRRGSVPTKGVTGYFEGSALGVAKLDGPITCLDITAKDISFVYPVTKASGLPAKGVSAVLITIARGSALKLGFMPLPTAVVKGCAPSSMTPLGYHGTLKIKRVR